MPPLAEAEEFVDGGEVEGEPEDGSERGHPWHLERARSSRCRGG
jgi:hypothetical protein